MTKSKYGQESSDRVTLTRQMSQMSEAWPAYVMGDDLFSPARCNPPSHSRYLPMPHTSSLSTSMVNLQCPKGRACACGKRKVMLIVQSLMKALVEA